jgi:hypothetical protein
MGVELKGVVVNTEERRSRVADGIRSRNFTYMEALYRPLIAQNSVVNGFAPKLIRLEPFV